MTKLDRLGGALQEVEAPLGRALQEHSPFLQWLDSDLQLSYSQCGIATAALQLYLAEQCGIKTHRRKASLPLLTTPYQRQDDPTQHVVLSTEDQRTICPTYTQFFELVGHSAQLAQRFPDMRALLPERKIALFREADELDFGEVVAQEALRIRDKVQPVLAGRAMDFYASSLAILKNADEATVVAIYQSIWQSQSYRPFTVEAQTSGYGDDRFEVCIRKIVDAI